MNRRARAAAAGIGAAATGLGAGELVAAVFDDRASPILSVGSFVIDLTPPFLKSAVIAVFGTGDKPFLIVVLLVLVLGLGAVAGLLRARNPIAGIVAVSLVGLIAAVAAVTRTGATPLSATPSVVAAAVGAAVLARLTRQPTPVVEGRRGLLAAGAWALAGVVAGGAARAFTAGDRATGDAIARIRLPEPTATVPAIPSNATLSARGITPLVTANADFYRIDISLNPPAIDPADWMLEITGEVERPLRMTYAELTALPFAETLTTLMCVSNPVGGDLNGTARWLGTPIRDLLARARPKAGADMVLSSGADGFTASTPLSVLQDADRNAVFAIGMNGAVLPQLHGFPVRMVVPGLYGYVSATKWLTKLEVTRFDRRTAYWTDRGWSAKGPIKVSSRIDVPGGRVPAGVVTVAGVAWSPHVGIARVQLQVDEGPWRDCELSEQVTVDIWRQWRFRWTADPGDHLLRVRATDTDGLVQTARVQGEIPDGATGLHTVKVTVTVD